MTSSNPLLGEYRRLAGEPPAAAFPLQPAPADSFDLESSGTKWSSGFCGERGTGSGPPAARQLSGTCVGLCATPATGAPAFAFCYSSMVAVQAAATTWAHVASATGAEGCDHARWRRCLRAHEQWAVQCCRLGCTPAAPHAHRCSLPSVLFGLNAKALEEEGGGGGCANARAWEGWPWLWHPSAAAPARRRERRGSRPWPRNPAPTYHNQVAGFPFRHAGPAPQAAASSRPSRSSASCPRSPSAFRTRQWWPQQPQRCCAASLLQPWARGLHIRLATGASCGSWRAWPRSPAAISVPTVGARFSR